MKQEELKEMLEDNEFDDFELNPAQVNWGPWAGDLDLNSLLKH
jgi:hypothetical protein